MRAEYTQTKGISYSLGTTNRNHYWRLFPVVDVVYSINESNTLSLSYAGRIRRPSYWLLDPFRWYTSKYDYSEGNPFLKPAYIHDLSLSYMHGNALYAKLYFSKTDKDFGRMVFLDGKNIQNQVERAGNFLDIAEWGADLEYSPLLCSWLETKLSGGCFTPVTPPIKRLSRTSRVGDASSHGITPSSWASTSPPPCTWKTTCQDIITTGNATTPCC